MTKVLKQLDNKSVLPKTNTTSNQNKTQDRNKTKNNQQKITQENLKKIITD